MNSHESERDRFEAWALAYGRICLDRQGDGYCGVYTNEAWVGWQARAALASPQTPPAKIAFMDGIDWQHHVGNDPTPQRIYASAEDVEVHGPACGVVRIQMTEIDWPVEQRYEPIVRVGKPAAPPNAEPVNPAQEPKFAGWFTELPSAMSHRLWKQGGAEQELGYVALYER